MKPYLMMITLSLIVLSFFGHSSGGSWKFGGKVSMEQGDNQPDLVTAVTAEYQIVSTLSWRTDLEAIFRDMGTGSDFDISLPTNLLWFPLQHKKTLEPYMGPGLVYTYALPNTHYFGMNVMGGITINPRNKPSFGLEVKYTVTNFTGWTASDKFSISLTGAWEADF